MNDIFLILFSMIKIFAENPNHITAIATFGLFFVGILQVYLFYTQLKAIKKNQTDTKIAVEAAEKSANAAIKQTEITEKMFILNSAVESLLTA
jgi:hypothetical protein